MICKSCIHRRCETIYVCGGTWIEWKCSKLPIVFGNQTYYDIGKNMPKNCKDYEVIKWQI